MLAFISNHLASDETKLSDFCKVFDHLQAYNIIFAGLIIQAICQASSYVELCEAWK